MLFRKMVIFLLCCLPALLRAGTNDGSIYLLNDSPFILTAIIEASDGTYLGQFTVQPGQQRNFTTNARPTGYVHPGTPTTSLTPYTVIWQCPSEGFFSMCNGVSPGSLCTATQCPGSHFCSPKKEEKKEGVSSSLQKKK